MFYVLVHFILYRPVSFAFYVIYFGFCFLELLCNNEALTCFLIDYECCLDVKCIIFVKIKVVLHQILKAFE